RRFPQYEAGVAQMTAEAKLFAKSLAKEFKGKTRTLSVANTHSEFQVRTTYRDMQCEFMVFAGGFDLTIQNFRVEDMVISLNIEHRDNKLHPVERDGMLAIEGLFSEDFPIYHFPSTHSREAAEK